MGQVLMVRAVARKAGIGWWGELWTMAAVVGRHRSVWRCWRPTSVLAYAAADAQRRRAPWFA